MNNFLARAVLHQFRFGVAQVERLAEQLDGFAKTGRRFGFHQRAEFGGDFIHGIRAQAHGHALVRAHGVDGERKRRNHAVDGRLLEQQRLAAAGRFHFAVGDFGDFEFGGDGLRNALEFAGAVELRRQNRERIQKPYAREANRNDAAGNAADLSADFADERRLFKNSFCENLRHLRTKSYFGSRSATSAFSSFNSFSVAAIFARLKSLSGTFWHNFPIPAVCCGSDS